MAEKQAGLRRLFAPLWAGLLLTCWANPGHTIEIEHLYDALVPVQNQSASSRNKAAQKGLMQVLTKLSGSSKITASPSVQRAAKQVSNYISGYSYLQTPAIAPESEQGLAISINFSPPVIDRLLRSGQLPIWPADREPLLVWLVVDDIKQGRQLAGTELLPEAIGELQKAASLRGLPVIFPLLDLQDRLSLKTEDAWQFNEQQLQSAARRYQADNWLVIRLFETSQQQWRGSSWLSQGGKTRLQNFTGESLTAFLSTVINRTVDNYSQAYIYTPQATRRRLNLTVEGIGNYSSFKKLRDHLESMEIVSDWQILSLTSQAIQLTIAVEGDPAIFYAALKREPRIQPIDEQGRFRWLTSGQ